MDAYECTTQGIARRNSSRLIKTNALVRARIEWLQAENARASALSRAEKRQLLAQIARSGMEDADRIRAEAEEKAAERMKAAELAEKDFSMKETEMKAELERRREAAEKELDARIAGLSENRFRELNDTLESASAEIGKLLDKLKADIASKSQVADSTVRTVDEK